MLKIKLGAKIIVCENYKWQNFLRLSCFLSLLLMIIFFWLQWMLAHESSHNLCAITKSITIMKICYKKNKHRQGQNSRPKADSGRGVLGGEAASLLPISYEVQVELRLQIHFGRTNSPEKDWETGTNGSKCCLVTVAQVCLVFGALLILGRLGPIDSQWQYCPLVPPPSPAMPMKTSTKRTSVY